jgi:uncharacterized membrane protein YfcA
MNIAVYGHRFFLFGGAVLVAVAALQWFSRPRAAGGKRQARPFDANAVRTIFFFGVGIVAILMGSGVLPMPGGR